MRLPTRVRFMVTPFSSGSDLTTKHVARNKSGTVQDVPGDSNPMQETASGAASLDDFMFAIYGHGNQRQSPSCDLSFVSKRVGNSGEKLEVVVEVQHLESSSLDDLEWYIRSSKDFQWSCAFICKAKGFNQALDTIFIHCLSCQLPVLLWGKSIDTKQPRALRCNLSLETGFDLFCFASLHGRNRSFQSIYGNLQRVAHEQQPPGFCRPGCNSIAREAPGSRFGEQFGKLHNFPKRRIISLFTHFSPAYRAGNFKSLWSEASFNGGVAAGKECLGSAVKSHKTQKKQNTVTQWHLHITWCFSIADLCFLLLYCAVPCWRRSSLVSSRAQAPSWPRWILLLWRKQNLRLDMAWHLDSHLFHGPPWHIMTVFRNTYWKYQKMLKLSQCVSSNQSWRHCPSWTFIPPWPCWLQSSLWTCSAPLVYVYHCLSWCSFMDCEQSWLDMISLCKYVLMI